MNTAAQTSSKAALWTGRALTGLIAAFLIFDASIHMTKIAPVVKAFVELGFPLRLGVALGITELICIALYLLPPTSVLGALFLTGYLGGAVAVQLRVGHPLFAETLFPVYVAVLLWGGIYLREPRLRAIVPFLRASAHREENP